MVQRGGAILGGIALVWAMAAGCAAGSQATDDDGSASTTSTTATGGQGGAGGVGGAGGDGGDGGDGGMVPTCSEDPCKLTSPQCGCADGEACVLEAGGRGCAPAGDKGLAEACSGDCAAGHQCLSNPSYGAPPICMKWCASDDDCSGPGAICIFSVDGEESQLCSVNCDPVSGAGCPAAGTKCEVLRENDGAMRWLTICAGEGAGAQEAACTDTADCADGYGCFNVTDANMVVTTMCLRWCNTASPSCPGGSQCAGFQTPMVVGSITYGACVPTG